jgi:hypothetical protein
MENQNENNDNDEINKLLLKYDMNKDATSYLNLLISNYYHNKKFFEITRTDIGFIFKNIIFSSFWKQKERLKECINLIIKNECIFRKLLFKNLLEIENDHNHYCFSDFENIFNKIKLNSKYIYFLKTIKDVLVAYNNHIDDCDGRHEIFGKIKHFIFTMLYI